MAPRKSASAAGEEDGPTLTLIMEKGPLSGQRNDFRPGSLVHIGRLVRGNTLSIKDAGISTKHLLIQVDAASDPGRRRWTITDLGSSNGTVLNGAQLDPSEPTTLFDGDVIKIGEQTSIRVKFEVSRVENENEASSGNVRRNAKRRVREHVADLVVIEEDAELGLQNDENEEKMEKVFEIKANQGRNVGTRRTRNSAKNDNLATDLNVEEDKDLGPSGIRGSRGASTRRARNARKEENVDEIRVDLSVIEDKKTRRGGRGRKKQDVETICKETEKEEPNLGHKTGEEEKERSKVGVDESGIEVVNTGTEGVTTGLTSSSGVKEHIIEADMGKMVPDLEKMSLEEWFDFLDVNEPQDIIDQTEELLSEMRRKAERCHDFRLQHRNAKSVE